MIELTIVLRNRLSGELDRKQIAFNGPEVTLAQIAQDCGDWILQDGDTIAISDTYSARETLTRETVTWDGKVITLPA